MASLSETLCAIGLNIMQSVEQEGRWLASLPSEQKVRFLSVLGHELTIVGRNSYKAQTEELEKPAQLRKVNEVQHRVLACLSQLLVGSCEQSFQESIAKLVLQQTDTELEELMKWAWKRSQGRLAA